MSTLNHDFPIPASQRLSMQSTAFATEAWRESPARWVLIQASRSATSGSATSGP